MECAFMWKEWDVQREENANSKYTHKIHRIAKYRIWFWISETLQKFIIVQILFFESDPVNNCANLIFQIRSSPKIESDPALIRLLQRWAWIRTRPDWIRTEANLGRIRTGSDCSFFQNWRIRTGSGCENFHCFDVIIVKISKILVVIGFQKVAKW